MSRTYKPYRLSKVKNRGTAVLPTGSRGTKATTTNGRVLAVKISNELSPRGKAVKVQLDNEREEILKRAQTMDRKFDELLQLVSSKK